MGDRQSYEMLAAAVIKRACEDYLLAKSEELAPYLDALRKVRRLKTSPESFEKFCRENNLKRYAK